jgi:Family of unknown function (DUF5923)
VKDATILFRDMAGDAATHAATRVKPSNEDLAQMDRPAQDNTWHDTPDFSKDTMKNKFQGIYKGNPKEDVKAAASEGTSTAHPTGSSDPSALAGAAAQDRQVGGSSGIDAYGGANAAANTLQSKVDANLDQETKDKARSRAEEYRARTREYLSKKMPQERREQTIWRLKVCPHAAQFYLLHLTFCQKMVIECQQHPDYQRAIQTLLDLAEEYGTHANSMAKGGSGTVRDARSGLAQVEGDLKVKMKFYITKNLALTSSRHLSSDSRTAPPPMICGPRFRPSMKMPTRMPS